MSLGKLFEIDREQVGRQRRFLLLVSAFLLAKYAVGVEIDSSVESLGLKFTLERKEWLVLFGWIVWIWAVVRYAQYSAVVSGRAIEAEMMRETHWQAQKVFWRRVEKLIADGFTHNGKRVVGAVEDCYWPDLKADSPLPNGATRDHVAQYFENPDGGRTYPGIHFSIRTAEGGVIQVAPDYTLSSNELRKCERRAWWGARIKTHVFTDYIAPYFLAATPVIAAAAYYAEDIRRFLVALIQTGQF